MLENIVKKNIADIKPYQPGKPIEEVRRKLRLKKVIKLASNENPLLPPTQATRAIKKALNKLNRYPDGGCFYLKNKLSQNLELDTSSIIIGNGSDEIITFALKAFINEGDEVIVANPSFLIYEIAAKICNAKIIKVPLNNFRYDLKKMKQAITEKTKIVFIANPDNPTGSYVTKEEVKEFLNGLRKGVIVYLDEAYFEFAKDITDFPNSLEYLDKGNIIITRSFSKAYGLAGLRIGYGLSTPEIIGYMDKVREPFNVNTLAQVAALAVLGSTSYIKRVQEITSKGKKYLCSNFDRLGFRYVPSATNFVLVDMGRPGEEVFGNLLKLGIIVRSMKPWKLDNFIRVTVGTMKENKKFIKALEKVIGGVK